ncbi:MAG: hypothetical protein P1V81_05990 [Planctomycetota bacterium]|nr:hypothetical protein [Planctomycetota bacterium]
MLELLDLIFDVLFGRFFRRGPLEVRGELVGERLHLQLENRGKRAVVFAALEARGGDVRYPETGIAVRTKLEPAETRTVELEPADYQGRTLTVIDASGKRWPAGSY